MRPRRLTDRAARWARQFPVRALRGLAAGLAAAGLALTYRRQELLVVGLLAASVVGGVVVDAWHRRAPAIFERLETEPARLAPARASPPPRPGPPRRAAEAAPRAPRVAAPTPAPPLDLNRATAADLTRLPGIGPRLAARIVARRDALGGRFDSADDLAAVPGLGRRKATMLRPVVRVGAEEVGPEASAPQALP